MNHSRFFTVYCLLITIILSLSGCGGPAKPAGFPPLYPVSLKVMQEGQPLVDAAVSLRIADNSMTWSIGGRTDEQGIAVLWTHGKFRGAPAGTFKVAVEKVVNEGEKEMLEAADRGDTATAAKIPVNSYAFVKDEYTSIEKTPIEIEITKKSKMIEVDAGSIVKIKRKYLKML